MKTSKKIPVTSSALPINNEKHKFVLRWWHKLLFFTPIILFLIILRANDWYHAYLLHYNGKTTWATITKVSLGGVRDEYDTENVEYTYNVDGHIYTAYLSVKTNNKYVIGPLDIPVFPNQQFMMKYAVSKPDVAEIYLDKPAINTIINFLKDVSIIMLRDIPETKGTLTIKQAGCVARNIFRIKGYEGLSYFYFFDTPRIENFKYHKSNFHDFIQSDEIKKIFQECEKIK